MASHVVIVDSAARRTTIKTTPNKHLSDILEEACGKLGLDATKHGLKHNNKPVDVSRTIRLSGLSAGAKLELVQTSKSAGVVSVALQLPESEAQGATNGRLTDRFPSTTTLWLLLRKFEAGVAGSSGTQRNITARGTPGTDAGKQGAGRLYYQQPVLQIMNRELSSLTDLQKTLAQLGFNSGSALLRLSFRTTETPLEEAMSQVQEYFSDGDGSVPVGSEAPSTSAAANDSMQGEEQNLLSLSSPPPAASSSIDHRNQSESEKDTAMADPSAVDSAENQMPSGRPISVFRPPSSSTPSAAQTSHNPNDYMPTVEHAQNHQRMLFQASRNVKLLTEAEMATQATADAEKLAAIKEVEIKIRFPDQSAVSAKFKQTDCASDLYHFVRNCLMEEIKHEPFLLRNPVVQGRTEIIPDDSRKSLIKDIALRGRVLVIFGWEDTRASLQARSTKNVLKQELRAQAVEVKVQDVPDVRDDKDDPGITVNLKKEDQSGAGDSGEGKKKMPKWLNKLSKK